MGERLRQLIRHPLGGFGLVTLASLIIYSLYGFDGWLYRDDAIYLYAGQQFLKGIPPYLSIFDHKTPLASLLCGWAMVAGDWIGVEGVRAARIFFWLQSGLASGFLFLAGRMLWNSSLAGAISGIALTGFWTFGREAVSGPQAKTPMVLFQCAFLYFAVCRSWLAAGIAAALATWTWQPGGIYVFAVLLLPLFVEQRHSWLPAVVRATVGVAIPTIPLFGYFIWKDAFAALLEGGIWFNFSYLDQPPWNTLEQVMSPLLTLFHGYTLMAVLALMGMLMLLLRGHVCFYDPALRREQWPRWLPVMATLPFPVIWTVMDFQGGADLYPFLPYMSLGIGGLLVGAAAGIASMHPSGSFNECRVGMGLLALLGLSSALLYHSKAEDMLNGQRYSADQILEKFGPDVKVATIGHPESMVLLGMTNPNRYLFLIRGIDELVVNETPGGAEGFVLQLARAGYDAVTFGPTEGEYAEEFVDALNRYYIKARIGYFDVYARNKVPLPPSQESVN